MRERVHPEWVRKAIHLGTIGIPLAVWFLPDTVWRWPLVGWAAAVTAMDLFRLGDPRFGLFFRQLFGHYLRRHEEQELMGSTYLAIACLLSAVLMPKPIAVAVMGYLILGDGLAGLVGKSWGRVPLAFGKTLEGTAVEFAANLIVGWLVFRELGPALLGAAVATVVELLPLPLDDNFSIPLVAGTVLWLGLT